VPLIAAALAGVAPVLGHATAAPSPREALAQRVQAVRAALAAQDVRTPPAGGVEEAPPARLVAAAANWTNWPKWSKWSNWANK
jgi:hypothetical protein